MQVYKSAIKDASALAIWSRNLRSLVPNIELLNSTIDEYRRTADVDEVLVLDNDMWLPIVESGGLGTKSEAVATILKLFQGSCDNAREVLEGMTLRIGNITIRIENFTPHGRVVLVTGHESTNKLENLDGILDASDRFLQLLRKPAGSSVSG